MKKICVLLVWAVIVIGVIIFFLSNYIGISPNKAEDLYNEYLSAFNGVAEIVDEVPDMRITLNNDDLDDGRTHTYIDDMEISTYRTELSEDQISAIEKTQISELLKISRRGKEYFDSVIIQDGSAIFCIFSILGSEGIAYFENGETNIDIIIDEKTSIAPNWYYIRFHS